MRSSTKAVDEDSPIVKEGYLGSVMVDVERAGAPFPQLTRRLLWNIRVVRGVQVGI